MFIRDTQTGTLLDVADGHDAGVPRDSGFGVSEVTDEGPEEDAASLTHAMGIGYRSVWEGAGRLYVEASCNHVAADHDDLDTALIGPVEVWMCEQCMYLSRDEDQ